MPISETFGLEFKFGGNAEFLAKLESLMQRVDERFNVVSDSIEEMKGDLDELSGVADEAVVSFNDIGRSVDDMSESFSRLGERVKGAASCMLSMNTVRKLWDFGMGAISEYSIGARRENQLRNVMGNMGNSERVPEILGLVDEIKNRTIYDKAALIAGAGELATYVSGTESLKKMMGLLSDYAAGMTGGGEVAPEQMEMLATGLGMAYGGQGYESLRKKGFDVDKLKLLDALGESGGVETSAIRKKFGAVDKDLLAAVKAAGGITEAMRVDALKEALETWDGLAESVAGLDSSSVTRLQNKIADLRGEIGKRLAPVLNRLVDKVEEKLPVIEELMSEVGDAFELVVDFLADNMDTFARLAHRVGQLASVFLEFPRAVLAAYSALKAFRMGSAGALQGISELDAGIMKATVSMRGMASAGALLAGGGGAVAGLTADTGADKSGAENTLGVLGAMANGAMVGAAQFGVMGAAIGTATAAIFSIINAIGAFFDEVDEKKARDDRQQLESGTHDAMLKTWARYKKAKAAYDADPTHENEEELRRAKNSVQFHVNEAEKRAVGVPQYMRDLVSQSDAKAAGDAAKDAKGNLYMDFGDKNYEQKVELTADIDKVGLALNLSMRRFIESQLRLDRAGSIVTEVG